MPKLSWLLQIVVAVILLQTLFFKFTGAPESIYIFTTVGAEPWGRYGSGVMELVAAVLLLIPGTVAIGALLGGRRRLRRGVQPPHPPRHRHPGRRRAALRPRLGGAGRQCGRARDPPARAAARRRVVVTARWFAGPGTRVSMRR